jgi:hypothetical protein
MNALIFTQEQYNRVIAIQSGQHRIGPVPLTDGTYFVMEDVLTEIPDGIYKDKLMEVTYTIVPFEDIQHLIPVSGIEEG